MKQRIDHKLHIDPSCHGIHNNNNYHIELHSDLCFSSTLAHARRPDSRAPEHLAKPEHRNTPERCCLSSEAPCAMLAVDRSFPWCLGELRIIAGTSWLVAVNPLREDSKTFWYPVVMYRNFLLSVQRIHEQS